MADTTLLDVLVGQTCWYVSGGSGTIPSFELVFGEKIARNVPLRNPTQDEEFRQNRGSIELFVWSSWRLQSRVEVIASSDQEELGVQVIKRLRGSTVRHVSCEPPAWDLCIEFSGDLILMTFSDHVAPQASIDQNWELYSPKYCVRTGPGTAWEVQPR